jgi:hypothetical protein
MAANEVTAHCQQAVTSPTPRPSGCRPIRNGRPTYRARQADWQSNCHFLWVGNPFRRNGHHSHYPHILVKVLGGRYILKWTPNIVRKISNLNIGTQVSHLRQPQVRHLRTPCRHTKGMPLLCITKARNTWVLRALLWGTPEARGLPVLLFMLTTVYLLQLFHFNLLLVVVVLFHCLVALPGLGY